MQRTFNTLDRGEYMLAYIYIATVGGFWYLEMMYQKIPVMGANGSRILFYAMLIGGSMLGGARREAKVPDASACHV